MALLGGVGRAIHGPVGVTTVVVLALATTAGAWLIIPWILLRGDVRLRVLIPTAVITSIITFAYSASASVWMPETVTSNEAQFGLFGVALALVSWFSGAAICILIGACFGPVLAEDTGWIGGLVRGSGEPLKVGAVPSLPAPGPGAHAPGRVPGWGRAMTIEIDEHRTEGSPTCPRPLSRPVTGGEHGVPPAVPATGDPRLELHRGGDRPRHHHVRARGGERDHPAADLRRRPRHHLPAHGRLARPEGRRRPPAPGSSCWGSS